jgi:hypothetical protein
MDCLFPIDNAAKHAFAADLTAKVHILDKVVITFWSNRIHEKANSHLHSASLDAIDYRSKSELE